jgi:hypothetical protein
MVTVVENVALELKYQYFSERRFYRRASDSSNDAKEKNYLLMRLGLLLPSRRCRFHKLGTYSLCHRLF